MLRRLKIPVSELVHWHHSDITMAQRFQSTHNGKAPVHSDPNANRKPRLLDEDHIEALREFADDDKEGRGYYPDSKIFGLTIFLGRSLPSGASVNRAGTKASGRLYSRRSATGLR